MVSVGTHARKPRSGQSKLIGRPREVCLLPVGVHVSEQVLIVLNTFASRYSCTPGMVLISPWS